jgi:hypothetical protein
MIATQAGRFVRWLEGRTVVPTITALQGYHEELRAAEFERVKKLLASGVPPEQALELLARGLTNKFLHASDPGAEPGGRCRAGAARRDVRKDLPHPRRRPSKNSCAPRLLCRILARPSLYLCVLSRGSLLGLLVLGAARDIFDL